MLLCGILFTRKFLIVQITELDISLYNNNETNWNNLSGSRKTTLTDRELNTRSRQQATLYRDLFNMLEQKYNQGKLGFVNIWGVADRESWLNNYPVSDRTDYPLLFDRNYAPKPAFHELIRGR